MNGKDALQSARPNGTLVDVSDLEGTRFTPFLLAFFIYIYDFLFYNTVWKVFGKVSTPYVFTLIRRRIPFI